MITFRFEAERQGDQVVVVVKVGSPGDMTSSGTLVMFGDEWAGLRGILQAGWSRGMSHDPMVVIREKAGR